MISYGFCFVLMVLVVKKCAVHVQGEIIKSSLTFVIDYTSSMKEEIRLVKEEVNIIFEKVLNSKASQIENFVIATFNDPEAEVRTITKDRNEFKKALASIRLNSDHNPDCPEMAMTGIELGLQNSLPLSYLYVFTDASAKDYYKLEQIKSIAQKKQSQVVFLLTGKCPFMRDDDARYQVYHQVAQATGGQVFHMMKDDVKDILKYIEESVTGRGFSIVDETYPPGTHKVKFIVDAHTGDVLISLTGLGSKIGEVRGPGGIKPPAEPIVSGKNQMAVKRLSNLKPGDYEVEIKGKGEVHIIMFAKSDINFQLGFSIDSPTSIKDTVTRPPPEGNAFLGVRLLGEDVELISVKFFDLSNNVIAELPLTIFDKKDQFYISRSFHPPSTMFLVTVIGRDLKTGTPVIRTGPTPIARQDPSAEPAVNTAPEVTIQGAPKIIAEYDAPLKLKCNVHGYPAPDIIWLEKETGIMMSAKMQMVDVPYDFVSSLEIEKAIKNVTYECKASNTMGKTSEHVEVKTKRKTYFDVIEAPKDIRIEYTKEGSIVCKIDAYPPATVTWYKDGAEFIGNTNIDVSSDNSTLTIKNMQPDMQGKYSCEARSDLDGKVFIVDVAIFGVEEPVIDKSNGKQRVPEKTNAELSCRTLKGIPKPAIRWSFKPMGMTSFGAMTETTETVQLKGVRKDQSGTYQCTAQNAQGSDSYTIDLVVEYPPTIKAGVKAKQIKNGDKVRIPCDVTGEPTPTVKWFFKGTELVSSAKTFISSDHSIEFKTTPSDIGDYTCEAKNKLATAKITVSLDVLEAPVIDKSTKTKSSREKTDDALTCRILRGNPKPSIVWSFKPVGKATFGAMTETTETVQLKGVRKDQSGTYQCTAQNAQGSDSYTIDLVVEYPPTIKAGVKAKQIKNGDKVRIPCDVTGEPTPTVKWFFKGTELVSSAKTLISSDHSIEFKATPSDIGDYTCEAKNKLATAKITVSLDVLEAPVIDKSTKTKSLREKTDDALTCRILRGNPKPSIVWSFKPVGKATFGAMTETTETVQLKGVRKDQSGTYQCTAQNAQGSDSYTIDLVVEYPPTIKAGVKAKQIKNGDKVRIPCDVTGEPTPTVKWFFKGTELVSSAKTLISSDHSIEFKATPSDIGDYTCEARNKLATAKITVSLDVLEAPVIDKSTKTKSLREKTDDALTCRILRGNPKPSIVWSFKPVGKATFGAMTETTETVQLKGVRKDQSGTYQCTAQNAQGSDSYTIDLVVEYPPTIKAGVKAKQIKNGDKVRIPCDVTGEPTPTVKWFFKGTELVSSGKTLISSDHSIEFKATPSDIGDYTCEAKNKLATAKITVSLDVLEAPVIDKSTKTKSLREKTDDALTCRILRGNPKPSIVWSFKPVGKATFGAMTETTETVQLKGVRKDQSGTYQCTAQNAQGSDSYTIDLVVEYPPTIKAGVKAKQIKNGDKVRIPCDVTGEPTPTVKWFFKGTELVSSAKTLISSDHSIEFKATPSDIGDYTCEAKNKLATAKITVSLDVLEAPVIDKSTKTKSLREKTDDALTCRILRGNPKPSIVWSFKPVGKATFGAMTETTETVQLKGVRKDQSGTYQCTAQNAQGSDSYTIDLVVEYPPTIKAGVKAKQIKNGDKVRIPCDVTGEPTPTVKWFFKGTELVSSAKTLISSDHSIEFKATPSDIGDYTCEARNKLATAKITVSLDVLEAPVIDKSTKTKSLREKTDDALTCRILRGNPKPSIVWSFKPVGKATFGAMTETTETVQLKGVRKDQSGTYQCTAQNAQGSDSYTIDLVVEYPPTIKAGVKAKQIKNGDKVRIPCDVTGEPTPTVKWFFKGTELVSSGKTLISSDHSIEFKATPSDIGDYTCEAKNKLATAKITVSLDVLEAPVIDKSTKTKSLREKTDDALTCRILRGNPKPSIVWSFKPVGKATFGAMTETTETVQLKGVRKDQSGTYQCTAQNAQGSDSYTIDLVVEYPPTIKAGVKAKQIKNGDKVRIPCDVTGEPTPTVKWFFKGTELVSSAKTLISSDHSIEFKATPSDIGDYTCEAKNKLATAKITVSLDVLEAPVIDKSTKTKSLREKTDDALTCRILRGNPKPSIVWSFKPVGKATFGAMTETTQTVQLKGVRKDQSGTYQCTAQNAQGSDSYTIDLVVEYPPTIKAGVKAKQIKNGDKVRIPCDVTGVPTPTVKWFFKGTELVSSAKTLISSDHSIEFKATPSDIGDYTCEARNKLATAKITVSLDVLEAPVIDKSTKTKSLREKTDDALTCRILRGNPKPSIVWSFKPVGKATFGAMTETTETVQLKGVRKDQSGTYQCTAQNAQGSDSYTIDLVVEYPPTIKAGVKAKQIKNGDKVRIPCDVTGEPTPTVKWFFKGTKLVSSAKTLISSDHSIEFKATPSDIGDYTCEAKNKLATAKITVSLDVLEAPVIDKSTKTKSLREKTDDALTCRILRGNPKPSIVWSFKPVGKATFGAMTETTETVQLKGVRKDQSGTYQCTAQNAQGSDSYTIDLVVEYPPTIKAGVKAKQIKNGDKVRIPCDVTGEPTPTMKWFFKGTELVSSAKTLISSDHSIEFKATPSDIGDYTCEAKNKLATAKITVSLDVLEAPVIDKSTKTKSLREKTDDALTCRILRGNPKPSIVWSFKPVGKATFGAMTETTETVQLKGVRKDQSGTYQCTAQNAQGSDSYTIDLVVEYPPTIKAGVKAKQIKNGDEVRIPCDVTGEPTPTVKWFFKGTELVSSAKTLISSDHSIEFKATPSDIGDYACEAKNKLATAKITVSLDVLEAPVIDKSTKTKSLREKTDDALTCRILRGNPKPSIVWSFKPVGKATLGAMTETTETVQLKGVRKDQSGTYQCTAQNAQGSDSYTIDLVVEYSPTIKAGVKAKQIKNGDKVRIPCDVTGEPTPTVKWFFKGTELVSSAKTLISSDHSIEFKATPSDIGDYTCEAKNKLATAKITVSLDVLEAPVIDKSTKTKSLREKTDDALTCRILRGNPKPSIVWSFKPVGKATFGAMTETTETVQLKGVRKDQSGTYQCTAQNAQGSDSYTIDLVVEYPPTIKAGVKAKQIKNGDKVRIPCDVTGEPIPTVKWFFKGTELVSSAKTLISSDHSIEFKATPSDIGDYTCEARNKLATAKITVSLDVLEAPVIDKSTKTKSLREKTDDALTCRILRGNPKPSIVWSFKPVGKATFGAMTETTETVQLKGVRKDQSGTYQCTAQNAQGSDSYTIDLVVEYPPTIKAGVKAKQIKNGDNVRIPCDVTGEPTPTVKWFFKGTELVSSAKTLISSDHSIEFKATPSDIGDYACEAKNKLATAKITVSLDVLEAPVIDKSTKTKSLREKTDDALTCRILRGNPKPSIVWSFKPVGKATFGAMTETTETVQLKGVRKDQSGTYQCTAQNAQGSDSYTIDLVVEYSPTIKAGVKAKQIKNGDKVRIPCDVTGEPTPTVKWFFKGTELVSSAKTLISSDHSIEFKATPSDIGDYTCEAKNKLATAKITVSLDVLEAPVIDKSTKTKRLREKTDDALTCRILRGNPKPSIVWSFKHVGKAPFGAMTETTETVQLKGVRKDQSGTYQCTAQNAQGSDSYTIDLVVEYPPTIKAGVKAKQIKNGDKVRIPCDVTGEPTPTVKWFFKGTDLVSSAKNLISSDHSIEFKATPSDIGDYTCEAKNKLATAKITVSLDVLEAPVIDKSTKTKNLREKTDDALTCRILRGNPKPSIVWSFKPVGKATFGAMTETTETVQLKGVRKDQSGTYQCTAQNAQGSDSYTIDLVVEYPPTIKAGVKAKQIKNGDKVRIPCDVTGEPTPTVKWFFKGTELVSSAKTLISSDHSIEFKATPSDIGDYTCEAKNKLATAKITVSLDVLEAPVIDKSTKTKNLREKTDDALTCRILRGNPKPRIVWSFKPVGKATFGAITETTETVQLKGVRKDQSGTYQCTAQNAQGSDSYTIDLVVEYPPTIKAGVKAKQIKNGDNVRIPCDVTGEPTPTVKWFFKGTELVSSAKTLISSDHSIEFKVNQDDVGSYRCEATNKLGRAKKTTELQVYVPVTIKAPKERKIDKMVGQNGVLDCRADGDPEPHIKWTFQSSDPKIPAKDITPTGDKTSVVLNNLQLVQQGLYTCEAENGIGGSANITYDVKVNAPPAIVNIYPYKNFEVVEGDVALRIQCKATGSPKPTIVWKNDKGIIAMGSEWYDMENDGTLIIKNIDRASEGTYVCRAENTFGYDTELYEVTVRDYAVPMIPTRTKYVKEGETVKIDCGISHSSTDKMRWYKYNLAIASDELTLYSVTRSDDGLYTCRVSNSAKSRSVTTKVVVGFKPEFSTKEPDTVEFVHGTDPVIISCEAYGQPRPTSATWKHNGNTLGFTEMSYPLGMVYGATGTYECEVSNAFGSIRRTIKVTSKDCILDIKKDFPQKKQPIMYSRWLTWPEFPINDGYMIIPHEDIFYMNCPSKFSDPTLPYYELMAFCERDNTIKINGNVYNFADIQCNKEVEPQVSKIGIACLPGNTEYVKIGYEIHTKFLEVFDVCLDTDNNVPLFTKHKLSPNHTDRSTEAAWSNIQLPQDFDSLYDCRRQMYDITSTLGRGLSTRDSCCFGKRQLVSSHDLLPGIPTSSAYDYLNVIPHWSTCNSKNWEVMEQSVKELVKSTRRSLVISTGTANPRKLGGPSTDITLHDGYGRKQAVAPYLWKVVQDLGNKTALAIIQINIPELTATEASKKHVLCPDICLYIPWIKPSKWRNVKDGFTYCCKINEFEKAFGYNGRFSPETTALLFD